MRALGFLGSSRLAAGEQEIPVAVERWIQQWCFAAAAPTCSCHLENAVAELPTANEWIHCQFERGSLWMGGAWRQLIFGPYAEHAPCDAVAERLVHDGQQALVQDLLGALKVNSTAALKHGGVPAAPQVMGSRLFVQVDLEQTQLRLILDAELLDGFLPGSISTPRALEARAAAINGVRLTVNVSLAFATLPLGDVRGLRAGDILQGKNHFLDPLNFSINHQIPLAHGYLARQGQQLALQLTAPEQQGTAS